MGSGLNYDNAEGVFKGKGPVFYLTAVTTSGTEIVSGEYDFTDDYDNYPEVNKAYGASYWTSFEPENMGYDGRVLLEGSVNIEVDENGVYEVSYEGKDELDNSIKVYYKGVINFIDASGEED